jgi:hypothetical protein
VRARISEYQHEHEDEHEGGMHLASRRGVNAPRFASFLFNVAAPRKKMESGEVEIDRLTLEPPTLDVADPFAFAQAKLTGWLRAEVARQEQAPEIEDAEQRRATWLLYGDLTSLRDALGRVREAAMDPHGAAVLAGSADARAAVLSAYAYGEAVLDRLQHGLRRGGAPQLALGAFLDPMDAVVERYAGTPMAEAAESAVCAVLVLHRDVNATLGPAEVDAL